MRGDAGPKILLLTLLALFGGFAWLTHHPEAEIVRRAESWPFVGPLASRFRQRFSVREPSPPPAEPAAAREVVLVEPAEPPVGEGHLWVLAGTVMRREPAATSPKIYEFDAIANVTRLEKRGDWYRVWRRGREGWVYLEGYSDDDPPYGSAADPPRPLPSHAPDAAALVAARSFLAGGGRVLAAGPYTLYTDVDDEGLLAHLDRVAARLEQAYVERYERRPLDAVPREAVVLFAGAGAYRRLQNQSAQLLGLAASGHTASGLALLYVGERPRWEVAATLVHELVHTLNRRALGPALPSWLDEGLAEDLSSSAIAAHGEIELGSLGGERRQTAEKFSMHGGVAALWKLRDRVRDGRLIAVRDLLHLDWDEFVRNDHAGEHYAAAAFWVRFLLDAEDGRYAATFRAYLAAVANGEPATPEALRERLGLAWTVLNARFRLWIDFQDVPVRVTSGD